MANQCNVLNALDPNLESMSFCRARCSRLATVALQFWVHLRLTELNNDWYQCSVGLVSPEICRKEFGDNTRRSLHRFYELNISFQQSDSNYVAAMQEFACKAGLPEINHDDSWDDPIL